MRNVMLDLETLATKQNAVVVSIGAFAFDLDVQTVQAAVKGIPEFRQLGDVYYAELEMNEQVKLGRSISADTVQWWLKQTPDAQRAVTNGDRADVATALQNFSKFVLRQGDCVIWGNGSDFDNVILGSLYETFGLSKPWSYGKNRCFRTMKAACVGQKPERMGTHHNALDDAIFQTMWLCRMVNQTPRILGYRNDGVMPVA